MPDLIWHPVQLWIPAFAGMTTLTYIVAGVIKNREASYFTLDKFISMRVIITRIMVNYNWSQIMKTLSLSEAKMKFSSIVDMVSSTDEEIVITKNGRPAAVIISPDEYESIKETANIRSDEALMKEIGQGLNALKAKRAQVFTLDEL